MSDQQFSKYRSIIGLLLAVGLVAALTHAELANAESLTPDAYRISVADHKFDDTQQFTLIYEGLAPRGIGASHFEYAFGAISSPGNSRAFASAGPVWELPVFRQRLALRFGFSPTVIFGSTFDSRDMGGNLHFTSSASLVANFGTSRDISVALRIQHISNGGLSSDNPGMDMLGLTINYQMN